MGKPNQTEPPKEDATTETKPAAEKKIKEPAAIAPNLTLNQVEVKKKKDEYESLNSAPNMTLQ